jgi:hypothetical protein
MTETPKRKRLTDEEFLEYLNDCGIDPNGPLSRMEADHLQAREDRKALVTRMRAMQQEMSASRTICRLIDEALAEVGE